MPIDEQQREEEVNVSAQQEEEVNVTALLAEQGRVDQKKRKREKEKRELRKVIPYKPGDRVNLRDLLCNETRDYLINNKGSKVRNYFFFRIFMYMLPPLIRILVMFYLFAKS